MTDQPTALQNLEDRAWSELQLSTQNRRHPFRTGTLATVSEWGPEARTVVLRRVERGLLGFNTDLRAPKVAEMRACSAVTFLFYGFQLKLQIRARGHATIHHEDEVARLAWEKSALLSRRCYLAPHAPGHPSAEPDTNLADHLLGREPTEEESAPGFQNFVAVQVHVSNLDVLTLEFEGNLRASFSEDRQTWLSP